MIPIISSLRNPTQRIEEHAKILRRLLAQREHELQSESGLRRWIARIKINLWAWRETAREMRKLHKKDLYKL